MSIWDCKKHPQLQKIKLSSIHVISIRSNNNTRATKKEWDTNFKYKKDAKEVLTEITKNSNNNKFKSNHSTNNK